MFLLYKSLLFY